MYGEQKLSHTGWLFQASMWRHYARMWDGISPPHHSYINPRAWMEKVMRISREECLRRARIALIKAKELRTCESING